MLLDARLKTAAGLCRQDSIVADVGTDHALLACYLAMNGAKAVFASDVKDGPLDAARRTVAEYGVDNVTIVKSDGLREIPFADDVVICGMGGELIARIVSECSFTNSNTRFILQPMTKANVMRKQLYHMGFEIIREKTAIDRGRVYSVMLWQYTGILQEIDEVTALCGKNRDRLYLEKIAEKLLKNARNMEKSQSCGDEAQKLRKTADTIMRIAADSGK